MICCNHTVRGCIPHAQLESLQLAAVSTCHRSHYSTLPAACTARMLQQPAVTASQPASLQCLLVTSLVELFSRLGLQGLLASYTTNRNPTVTPNTAASTYLKRYGTFTCAPATTSIPLLPSSHMAAAQELALATACANADCTCCNSQVSTAANSLLTLPTWQPTHFRTLFTGGVPHSLLGSC